VPELAAPALAEMKDGIRSSLPEVAGPVKPTLVAATARSFLVIACVNVTNLLLARGAERQGEFALRAAPCRAAAFSSSFCRGVLLAIVGGTRQAVAVAGVRALIA
jgi:hypothetical protein